MAPHSKPKKLDVEGLWSYALSALGRRAHSTSELKQKLSRRAASASDVDSTLVKLRAYGFTDDRKFSEAFAASRLQNQGFGRSRVLRDLRARRVAPPIAESAVESAFSGVDEQQLIRKFLDRKYRGKDLAEFLSEEKNLASVYRRLRTAGFGSRAVLAVLKHYKNLPENFEEPEE